MSDLSFMSDISMTELRMLSVAGVLATAVMTTLLTLLVAYGGAALGRLIGQGLDRYRRPANGTTSQPGSSQLVSNGKRAVRARQDHIAAK